MLSVSSATGVSLSSATVVQKYENEYHTKIINCFEGMDFFDTFADKNRTK